MEKEANNQRAKEPDFVLQWGNGKRHRCVKVKSKDNIIALNPANSNHSTSNFSSDSMARKSLNSRAMNTKKDSFSESPHRGFTR